MQTALPSISTWGMVIDQRDDKILYTGTFTSAAANVFQTTNGGASWTSLGFNLPNNGDVWSIKKHPLDTNGIWAAVSHGVSGGIYRFSYPIASVQGSVRDSLTNDIVLLGRVKVISSADSVFLGDTNGEFTFQFYDTDPLPFVARVDAYPYYSKEVELDIIIGSVSTQDILLQRLPLTSFEGTVVDSSTHLPVQAEVTLTAHAVFGPANLSQSTDMSGHFEFTNVALPGSPYVSNYSLFIDPELPFGQLSIASLHIDTSNAPIQLSVNRADVFVVGEDSLDFQNYYRTALDTLRIKSNIWNTITKGPAPLSRGAEFSKKSVIYFTGNKHTPISQESLDTLVACLNAGCNLFLTGQDIAENSDTSILFHDYIGLKFSENSSVIYCSGSPGDLFDGMGFYTTVDGANDQTSRDVLRALSPAAIPVMEYGGIGTGKPSVVRIDSVGTGGKAIVMGFGFEAISVPMNRQKVMERIIKYFDGTAGVVEQHDQQLANHFSLAQNYPNPFNSSTIIRYRLPTSAYVSIRVYDVLGREVRVLVEELEDAGLKSIRFDSAGLSSGIYFYRMQSRKFTQTLKLLVLQ